MSGARQVLPGVSKSLLILLLATASALAAPPSLVLLRGSSARIEQQIARTGGRVLIRIPEQGALIAELPALASAALQRDPALLLATAEPVSDLQQLDEPAQIAAAAWNDSHFGLPIAGAEPASAAPPSNLAEPLSGDALLAPAWWDLARPRSAAAEPILRASGAGWENTSEYLAGRVSVNVMLLESDGSIDSSGENWSSSLESQLLSKSLSALSTLAALHPAARLSFTLHFRSGRNDKQLQTGYEPISRPADPSGTQGEALWLDQVLRKLGFSEGSWLYRARQLDDTTRVTDGSDWAVSLFVINASKDSDGKFADGRFAYSWLGGPHSILTSKNGSWGVANFDKVMVHELHHQFYALDEYASSGCDRQSGSGYLAATNDNCENGGGRDGCTMRDDRSAVCGATQRQVGSIDADQDGTADLLQLAPEVTLEPAGNGGFCGGIAALRGVARARAAPNLNPITVTPRRDITLRTLREVQLRVDGGSWQSGLTFADDGAFDGREEPYSLGLKLSLDRHRIEVRAIDDLGSMSPTVSYSVDAIEPSAPVLDSLRLEYLPTGTRLSWQGAAGASTYKIRRADDPRALSGALPIIAVAGTSWLDSGGVGTAFYSVNSADGCGNEAP